MFQKAVPQSSFGAIVNVIELTYHATVREVRRSHGNALMGLFMNIFQTVVMVGGLYAMLKLFNRFGSTIHGDYLLYVMSGIFLFMAQNKTMGAVVQSDATTAMMRHAPLNSLVTISAAALSALYLQVLSGVVILSFYHVLYKPIEIDNPAGMMGMIMGAWFIGIGVGMVFLAIKPWSPDASRILTTIYGRANMIFSGKMFLANSLPHHLRKYFDWNPLFHAIDQLRGYVFINYNPHFTSPYYPYKIAAMLIVIGMMGEFYTRRRASLSWDAKR